MRICICGGGSLGHICTGILGVQKDVDINILTGHPELWGQTITVTDMNGKQYVSHINKISSQADVVVANQDIVLLCLPGYLIEETLHKISPFIGSAVVGSVVSSTGFFFFAHKILPFNIRLFGFQRVPFISRVAEYGKTGRLLGYKPSLAIALEGFEDQESFRVIIEQLFRTPVKLLNNYLEASLTNSNPILHTGRLYSMFAGHENDTFDTNILFYREWTDDASEIIVAMDKEFFALLSNLGINSIPTLLDYYECDNITSLTKKIQSIPAFQTIPSPLMQVSGGWKVDFSSRYFTEDFPFGLHWIQKLCRLQMINCPVINRVYSWGINRLNH